MKAIGAGTISKLLKANEFVITSDRLHEGTLVQKACNGAVRVSIQNDRDKWAMVIAQEAARVLTAAGYAVELNENSVLVKRGN